MLTTYVLDDDKPDDRKIRAAFEKALKESTAIILEEPLATVGATTAEAILGTIVSEASPARKLYLTMSAKGGANGVSYQALLDAGIVSTSLGGLHAALEGAWKAHKGHQFAPQLIITKLDTHYVTPSLLEALRKALGL